jgi:hypothetical protein
MKVLLAMAAIAVPAMGVMASELLPLDCREATEADIPAALARDGLAVVDCPLPDSPDRVLILSDENISWPVVVTSDRASSFEAYLLDRIDLLGPGLAYFETGPGAVLFDDTPPRRVVIRFQSADPVTLEPAVRWLAVSLDPTVLGAAVTPEAAAGLQP